MNVKIRNVRKSDAESILGLYKKEYGSYHKKELNNLGLLKKSMDDHRKYWKVIEADGEVVGNYYLVRHPEEKSCEYIGLVIDKDYQNSGIFSDYLIKQYRNIDFPKIVGEEDVEILYSYTRVFRNITSVAAENLDYNCVGFIPFMHYIPNNDYREPGRFYVVYPSLSEYESSVCALDKRKPVNFTNYELVDLVKNNMNLEDSNNKSEEQLYEESEMRKERVDKGSYKIIFNKIGYDAESKVKTEIKKTKARLFSVETSSPYLEKVLSSIGFNPVMFKPAWKRKNSVRCDTIVMNYYNNYSKKDFSELKKKISGLKHKNLLSPITKKIDNMVINSFQSS